VLHENVLHMFPSFIRATITGISTVNPAGFCNGNQIEILTKYFKYGSGFLLNKREVDTLSKVFIEKGIKFKVRKINDEIPMDLGELV